MIDKKYADYSWEKASALLNIDSPTGFTKKAAEFVKKEFSALGFPAEYTVKGGVLADLGGKDDNNALLLEAHTDTLGGMVAEVKSNGRLRITPLGGMNACNAETENVRIYTRSGKIYEGALQICNASIHVCFEPRTRRTESGYLKSRFLDDKLSVGILLGFAKYLKDNGIVLPRRVYVHVTVYEEVGHGGSSTVPGGVTEAISVDMGCVGDGLKCTEKQVSVCAKDSGGPYSYDTVGKLIEAAKAMGADYAVDVYPHYGSDVEATLRSGADIRHGLIGAGVYASHGYERSHIDGVYNTLKLLCGYLNV